MMLIPLLLTALAVEPLEAGKASADSNVRIVVDSARQEVTISVGPISIPAMTVYGHHAKQEYVAIQWPVSGWLRGYRVDLVDSSGVLLSRDMIHHVGLANLERRQLAYTYAERLLASARETQPFVMPASMGVPLSANDRTVLYYALVNDGSTSVSGVLVRLTVRWTPDGTRGVRNVLPLYANAKEQNGESISFDVPPGVSTTSAEFTIPVGGRLRAMGGHLHDYGVELRLEDAETHQVLARVKARRTSDGLLRGVSLTRFLLKRRGLRLHANRRYRVVAVYDNPTSRTIAGGAMGFIVGAFIPDDVQSVQRIDTTDAAYQRDLNAMLSGDHAAGRSVHGHR
jgi:hypothetical protein